MAGNPNSDSAANNAALTNFITTFSAPITAGNPIATKVTNLQNLFAADSGGPPPTAPGVGIASHGPNFTSQADIGILFTRLFTSFPDLTLKEKQGFPRLYSLDAFAGLPTIGTATTLQGTFQSAWFPKVKGQKDTVSHYSKPLSDIIPNAGSFQSTKIPAFAVFALDGSTGTVKISQLSIYMDRYRFKADLEPAADAPPDSLFETGYHHRRER
jgi:hypothetical protein